MEEAPLALVECQLISVSGERRACFLSMEEMIFSSNESSLTLNTENTAKQIDDTGAAGLKAVTPRYLVLDSVSPTRVETPATQSWVTISGRMFSDGAKCLVNGVLSETIVMSTRMIQYSIPAQGDTLAGGAAVGVKLEVSDLTHNLTSTNYFILPYRLRASTISSLTSAAEGDAGTSVKFVSWSDTRARFGGTKSTKWIRTIWPLLLCVHPLMAA